MFKLTKLRDIYRHSVTELGFQVNSTVNKTHLKNQILQKMPELEVATKGQKDVFLVYRSDIAKAVTKCHESAIDNENAILKQAAKIIKEDMFKMDETDFSGTFESNCQVNCLLFIVLFAKSYTNQIKSNYLNSHGEEAQEKPPGL